VIAAMRAVLSRPQGMAAGKYRESMELRTGQGLGCILQYGYTPPFKITVVIGVCATSLTQFIENMCNICVSNKFIKKVRFKDLSNNTNYVL
jgi:hypothetical protein